MTSRASMLLFALTLALGALCAPGAVRADATTTPAVATTTATSTVPAPSAPLFVVSGWVPYWRIDEGTRDARKHLDALTEIHPFGFAVQPDGRLQDLADLGRGNWLSLFRNARSQGVLVLPTVIWSDTASIADILSNPDKRASHIRRIVSMVKSGRFDGVDIDYEGKSAETKDAYSAFLGELKTALDGKLLSCTVEARTPPASLYPAGKIPASLEYANDYAKLNEYCDRVNIMTYDQQRADLALDAARVGAPYYPVADVEWVRKVVTLAMKDISPSKIVLSVPTYGRELQVTVAPQWYKSYAQLWSLSEQYALDTAQEYGIAPSRNSAGEMSFSYIPKDSPFASTSALMLPPGPAAGNAVAAKALEYATATGETVTFNLVWWSDAGAVAEKVALAKELGLAGVALFKVDGGESQDLWKLFEPAGETGL